MKNRKYPRKSYLLGISFFGLCIFTFTLISKVQDKSRIAELIENRAAKVISRLSLEEKVGQLFHIGIEGVELEESDRRIIQKYKVGGVILFAHNLEEPKQIHKLNRDLQKNSVQASGIPLFISTDQEGGRVRRLGPEASMNFPSAMAFGQTANPIYTEEAAFITAYELRKLGLNWVLAPVLDINNNPRNPVINVRSFGSDPELVAQMGKAYIRGNRRALSLSAIKHFPGHGDTDMDSHLALPHIRKSLKEIQRMELFPFQSVIQDAKLKAEALMTAHVLFPFLDAHKPATLSREILKKLLRQELGFQGLVSTDAMEMKAISQRYAPREAARLAFKAGVDVILLSGELKKGKTLRSMFKALLNDFRKKELDIKDLELALGRQLKLKIRKGLFHRWRSPYRIRDHKINSYWQEQEKKAQDHYEKIIQKYAKRGISLNTLVSRESITSLRKPFYGLSLSKLKKARLLLRSEAMRKESLEMGIASKQIYQLHRNRDILPSPSKFSKTKSDIYLVEVKTESVPFWNALVALQKKAKTEATLIALYTGNPFLQIAVPQNGAVLSSCSDTEASQRALIHRALYPQKRIPKAKLSLPKMLPIQSRSDK